MGKFFKTAGGVAVTSKELMTMLKNPDTTKDQYTKKLFEYELQNMKKKDRSKNPGRI